MHLYRHKMYLNANLTIKYVMQKLTHRGRFHVTVTSFAVPPDTFFMFLFIYYGVAGILHYICFAVHLLFISHNQIHLVLSLSGLSDQQAVVECDQVLLLIYGTGGAWTLLSFYFFAAFIFLRYFISEARYELFTPLLFSDGFNYFTYCSF